MVFWRKRQPGPDDAADQLGYTAIVSLIATRLNLRGSIQRMQAAGVDNTLATRYLDLAMVVAAREILSAAAGVVLPDNYVPTIEIPGLSSRFADCHLTAQLLEVYRAEPTAATLLGPLTSDAYAANRALTSGAPGMRVRAAAVGDGFQVGFARATYGDDRIEQIAADWPELA